MRTETLICMIRKPVKEEAVITVVARNGGGDVTGKRFRLKRDSESRIDGIQ